jgi:predicted MFS family arabinose efflux permease
MLLVYAMTRATQDGWMTATTIALLSTSAVLLLSFLVIESRSKAPLLPMRIFRLRTLAAANAIAVVVASVAFSEFFLLTL